MSLAEPGPDVLSGASLFLDLDGTLLDLVDRPGDVVADPPLRDLLARLAWRLEGRMAVVSGRSLAQMAAILGPVAETFALAGSHGCEHRAGGVTEAPPRIAALDEAARRLRARFGGEGGVLVENKTLGVAAHYRLAPALKAEVAREASALAEALGLWVQEGKNVVELRAPGGDKGGAVHRLMAMPPMAGTRPVFVGDDLTDEAGFEAAHALGGAGIVVGERRPTAALYTLGDPTAVRDWLAAFAA